MTGPWPRLRWPAIWAFCAVALAGAPAAAAPRAEPPAPAVEAAQPQVLVLLRLAPQHFRPQSHYGSDYGDDAARAARRRLADRIAHRHGLLLVTDWPMPLLGLDCYVMAAPAGVSAAEMAARLARDPDVVFSQPMQEFRAEGAAATHNDPLYQAQPAAREWRLAELHQLATGRNVTVAVVDSQVDTNHPDLQGQVAVSENFVASGPAPPEQHGTGVAGVIAARADNNLGIAGVAPRARLLALRACWERRATPSPETVCNTLTLAKALHFAVEHRAEVINLSLSGPADPLLGRLVDAALRRDATVVGAFDPKLPQGGFPASHPGVIAVADESLAQPPAGVYSAPGRDVPTTEPGGRWSLVDGSSYAAAHVSGLVALARERRRTRGGSLALASTHPGGRIDACATLLSAAHRCDCNCLAARKDLATLRR